MDFEALYDELGARFTAVAASIVGSRRDAEDVVQEAFLKAYRARDRFRGEASPATWLRRIVVHEAIAWRRRRGLAPQADDEATGAAAGTEPSPEARASDAERAKAVRDAIERLPEAQRTAVLLRELEGLGFQEIATLLEIPLGTAESRVMRGRERLKEMLRGMIDGL